MKTNLTLELFELFENNYIGKLQLSPNVLNDHDNNYNHNKVPMFIIMDRSGSMGANVQRFINKIIPNALQNLGYEPNDKTILFAFDNNILGYELTINGFLKLNMTSGGTTYMSPAVTSLHDYIKKNSIKEFRLLTISDGALHDQTRTLETSSKLFSLINTSDYIINSQAIRLFTGSAQPDTRGLASVLQLNTLNGTKLKDIDHKNDDESIIQELVDLFADDGMNSILKLQCDKPIIKSDLWKNGSVR